MKRFTLVAVIVNTNSKEYMLYDTKNNNTVVMSFEALSIISNNVNNIKTLTEQDVEVTNIIVRIVNYNNCKLSIISKGNSKYTSEIEVSDAFIMCGKYEIITSIIDGYKINGMFIYNSIGLSVTGFGDNKYSIKIINMYCTNSEVSSKLGYHNNVRYYNNCESYIINKVIGVVGGTYVGDNNSVYDDNTNKRIGLIDIQSSDCEILGIARCWELYKQGKFDSSIVGKTTYEYLKEVEFMELIGDI